MRQDHDIVQRKQRLRHMRLPLEHIQCGPGDFFVHQRIDQGGLIDDAATRDVDDETCRPQRNKNFRRYQMARVGPACAGYHHEIGPLCQPCQGGFILIGHTGHGVAVVIAHIHVEACCTPGNRGADAAQSRNPQALATDPRLQGKCVTHPFAATDKTIRCRQTPGNIDHQPEGNVRHAIVEHVGRIAHCNVAMREHLRQRTSATFIPLHHYHRVFS